MNQEGREEVSQIERGEVVKATKEDVWLERKEIKDGMLIYERKRKFIDPEHPEKGVKYDYEKEFSYDEDGNLIREVGRDYLKVNAWQKDFGWEDGKMISEHGKITEGPDDGHEWQTSFERDANNRVLVEKGEILAQGKNPEKQKTGHTWETHHFYDEKGKWRGAVGRKKNPGDKEWTVWTKGEITEDETEEFPE